MDEQIARELAERYFLEAYAAQREGRLDDAIAAYRIDWFPTAEAHTFLGWTYSFKDAAPRAGWAVRHWTHHAGRSSAPSAGFARAIPRGGSSKGGSAPL